MVESGKMEFCSQHKRAEMVYLNAKRCSFDGCSTRPSYGMIGSGKMEFCFQHKSVGMISFNVKRCSSAGCYSRPTYGAPGSVKPEVCLQHKRMGMLNLTGKWNLQDEGSTWPSCEMAERFKTEIFKQKGKIRYSFQSSPALVYIGRVATPVTALMPSLAAGVDEPQLTIGSSNAFRLVSFG